MPDNNRGTALVLLITCTLIWGTSFILIKQGLKVFAPDEVGAIRVTAAALFLFPAALFKFKELKSTHTAKLLLVGLMGTFIPAFLFAIAQTRLDRVAGLIDVLPREERCAL